MSSHAGIAPNLSAVLVWLGRHLRTQERRLSRCAVGRFAIHAGLLGIDTRVRRLQMTASATVVQMKHRKRATQESRKQLRPANVRTGMMDGCASSVKICRIESGAQFTALVKDVQTSWIVLRNGERYVCGAISLYPSQQHEKILTFTSRSLWMLWPKRLPGVKLTQKNTPGGDRSGLG